ncbi:metallophosphoesterase [Terriglobus aquaticus]|uniref:Metallophosphoesterase n=1 Tax=Terriglobus aquaticus TaxID=940139 RepID=A0ABW9KJM7_9BACT|nr:metallophosphoesterase [Terriglobus aquaticus]
MPTRAREIRFGVRARLPLLLLFVLALLAPALGPALRAQAAPAGTVTAALLSDPHLDPFRDPSRAKRLAAAPVAQWSAILAEPPAADAAAQFANLQATCNEKLTDSDPALELSAFDDAAKAHPSVVLVPGDMLVHGFACRYRTLLDPSGTDSSGLSDFAAKTIEFQLLQLQQRFPEATIHFAPGNNDTDCEDYALDEDSRLLHRLAPTISAGWRNTSAHDRDLARQDFMRFGSYALPMAATLPNTRVIALDDLYLASDYKGTCGHQANRASAAALLSWLRGQLAAARAAHQAVWVLAHIPPEVNIYRTYLHPHDICHGQAPATFFPDDTFANLLVEYADTVRVFISGHSHVDEIHRIEGSDSAAPGVALKTVPSISPVSGNAPAYLLAQIDPGSATLVDYSKRVATAVSPATPAGAEPSQAWRWSTAYDFRERYSEPNFTARSVSDLLHRWETTPDAAATQIDAYQTSLASGLRLFAVRATWPQQRCAMQHSSAAGFTACACSAPGGMLPPAQNAK